MNALISRARHVLADDTGGVVGEYALLLGALVTLTLAASGTISTAVTTLVASVAGKISSAAH